MVSAVVLTATGINADGHREVLGLRVATTESSAAWNGLLADLVARGLTGVRLVTSDAHTGLVEAIAANLPGLHIRSRVQPVSIPPRRSLSLRVLEYPQPTLLSEKHLHPTFNASTMKTQD